MGGSRESSGSTKGSLEMPVAAMTSAEIQGLVIDPSDEAYEEDILRNPYSVKIWFRYLAHKKHAPSQVRSLIFERALKEMPRR